jgi:hypothetical protein
MATYSDSFNRANENPLNGTWDPCAAPAMSECKIVSNEALAQGAGGSDWSVSIYNDVFQDNQYSQVTIGTVGDRDGCPALRCGLDGDANEGDGYGGSNWIDGKYEIHRYDDGSASTIATSGAGKTNVSNGIAYKHEVSGTTFTIYVGGVSQHSTIDATYSSGKAGIAIYNNGSMGFDAWEGGDLGAVAPDVIKQPIIGRGVGRGMRF